MGIEAQEFSHTRNGAIRKGSERVFGSIARFIHRTSPRITANAITDAGFDMSMAGVILSEAENVRPTEHHIRNKLIALGLMVGGFLMDAVDGPYARATGTASDEGAIKDTINDKKQESRARFIMAASSAFQGNHADALAQTTAGILHPLPSLFRTDAERHGYSVKEDGEAPLSKLGTRLPRLVLLSFASLLPKSKQKYVRLGLTALSIAGDLSSILERVSYEENGKWIENDGERKKMQQGANLKYPHVEKVVEDSWKIGRVITAGILVSKKLSD